jgi:hypothetical protein
MGFDAVNIEFKPRPLKKAFSSIGYANSNLVNQISSALATIGQEMGELRNEIGLTSHGKSLEEIKQRNNNIDLLTREFLIDTVELVSVFLIRNFETKHLRTAHETLTDSLGRCPQFYGVTGTNLFAHRFQQGFGIFQ